MLLFFSVLLIAFGYFPFFTSLIIFKQGISYPRLAFLPRRLSSFHRPSSALGWQSLTRSWRPGCSWFSGHGSGVWGSGQWATWAEFCFCCSFSHVVGSPAFQYREGSPTLSRPEGLRLRFRASGKAMNES